MSASDPTNPNHGNNGNASRKASILPHFVPHSDDSESMRLESNFFPQKEAHRDMQPNASVSYNLMFPFSSIINGYKMAEVPSPTILQELFAEELQELNKFAERKMVDHKFVHNKEYMRFHVTLKPFSWASGIPIISWIFDISLTANEDWIVDWHQHRAECLISNESLRWTFSVDELVIIQGMYHKPPITATSLPSAQNKASSNSTFYTKLHKSLYVSTFVPVPSIMFWNYKQYSDAYIKVISKLAAFRCSSSPLEY